MSNETDIEAIAREAARQHYDSFAPCFPKWSRIGWIEKLAPFILAAIEKATEELRDANDNLFKVARKHSVENQAAKKELTRLYEIEEKYTRILQLHGLAAQPQNENH